MTIKKILLGTAGAGLLLVGIGTARAVSGDDNDDDEARTLPVDDPDPLDPAETDDGKSTMPVDIREGL